MDLKSTYTYFLLLAGIFCLLLLYPCNTRAQDKNTLTFEGVIGREKLVTGKEYRLSNGATVSVDLLKFYVSEVQLWKKGQKVWGEENGHHLLTLTDSSKFQLSLPGIKYDQLTFTLGTDSATNVSGAMGGDLDPTKGMYWSWQSGYINFKLEGRYVLPDGTKGEFQFHLGGYSGPHATARQVILKPDFTTILVDVAAFLEQVDLAELNHIMSPGSKAAELADIASTIFQAK